MTKKKWLSVLLAVVLVAAMLPTMAYATGTMESVYLNGASGDDANTGEDSASAVKTFDKAMDLVADDGVIYICGQVTVDSALTVSDVKIERAEGYGGALITVNSGAELTISNTVIDGKKADETNATGYLINVYNGTLNMQNGTQLINNNATAVYVNNRSYFNMTGGIISGNMIENPIEDFYYSGAGIYNAGITVISGGEISNNTVTNYDGGAIRNDRGTLTLGGNAVVKDNKALSGAAISTSGGAKPYFRITLP